MRSLESAVTRMVTAARYVTFHHDWRDFIGRAASPFTPIKDHVLLPFASRLEEADAAMAEMLRPEVIDRVVALIPDAWLDDEPTFASKREHRAAYAAWLGARLRAPRAFAEEAARARSLHV